MISEISLGGHGGQTVEDRVPVLEKAVELGMNYVDNNIDGECDLYGEAMAKSQGRQARQVVHRLRLLAGEDHHRVRDAAHARRA